MDLVSNPHTVCQCTSLPMSTNKRRRVKVEKIVPTVLDLLQEGIPPTLQGKLNDSEHCSHRVHRTLNHKRDFHALGSICITDLSQ